ncbi:MAG: PrsW family intramembrane metalloprotease [FCB group bacterium]|nr:PrsW family intramembrane metalloprotease [FCB group bacterium]
MSNWWLFVFSVLPPLFFVIYIYKRDRIKPEPKKAIFRIFMLGVLSCGAVLLIGVFFLPLSSFFEKYPLSSAIFNAFIMAGFIEEGVKFLLIRKYVYKKPYFDEIMDGIVYTVVAGMGFACIENIVYVMMSGGIDVAIARAILSVPMHASCSAIMGFYIGMTKFEQDPVLRRKYLWKGFLFAWMLHGLYDVCIFIGNAELGNIFYLGIFPIVIFAVINARKRIKTALRMDEERNASLPSPASL